MHNHIHSAAYTISSTIYHDWVCKNMNNPCTNLYSIINILWNWYVFCLRRQTLDSPSPLVDKHGHFDNPPPPSFVYVVCTQSLFFRRGVRTDFDRVCQLFKVELSKKKLPLLLFHLWLSRNSSIKLEIFQSSKLHWTCQSPICNRNGGKVCLFI